MFDPDIMEQFIRMVEIGKVKRSSIGFRLTGKIYVDWVTHYIALPVDEPVAQGVAELAEKGHLVHHQQLFLRLYATCQAHAANATPELHPYGFSPMGGSLIYPAQGENEYSTQIKVPVDSVLLFNQ